MLRIITSMLLLAAMILPPVVLADVKAPIKNYPALTGDELLPDVPYYPTTPGLVTDSPGELVGYTQYDFQTNGSTGNRVAIDNLGSVHVAWMKGMPYPAQRRVYFNCKTSTGWIYPETGSPVNSANGDGYCNVSATSDGRTAVAYHNSSAENLSYALDAFNCLGSFSYSHPPADIDTFYLVWPYMTISLNGYTHFTATTRYGSTTGYTRTADGINWTPIAIVDTNVSISTVITSSPVSNKVAIVYVHQNPDSMVSTTYDIYYIQSLDGITWDWAGGKVNVTHYGPDDDSLSAGSDVDAVYDYNDNLHIAWNAHWTSGNYYYYLSWLYHYSTAPGVITEVIKSDSLWPSAGCDFGGWNWHYSKMSLGASINGSDLFVTCIDFDTTDCSMGGYGNADIYCHLSSDNGATWRPRINLTNSQTPMCQPGDCDSDHWPTLAERADDYIHLFYVNDKDAGSIPQTEGSITDNPMLYYNCPVSLLGVEDDLPTPRDFSLSQNYPNPFNAQTRIDFSLDKPSRVTLEVYDILGARVATLFEGRREAGAHSLVWDASEISSGVYFARLMVGEESISRRMVLLK